MAVFHSEVSFGLSPFSGQYVKVKIHQPTKKKQQQQKKQPGEASYGIFLQSSPYTGALSHKAYAGVTLSLLILWFWWLYFPLSFVTFAYAYFMK